MRPLAVAQQASAEIKIGVVNFQKLLEEAPQTKTAMQALENEFAPRRRELLTMQNDLKARDEKLQKEGAVMAEADRAKAEKTLRDSSASSRARPANSRTMSRRGAMRRSARCSATCVQEIQTYANAQGFDLVLGDGVFFAKGPLDITANVLAVLKTKPATLPASAPAAVAPAKPSAPNSIERGFARGCAPVQDSAWVSWRYASGWMLRGDPDLRVSRVATLPKRRPGSLSFLANSRYRSELAATRATRRDLEPPKTQRLSGRGADRSESLPRLRAHRRAAASGSRGAEPGIHPSAVVADGARIVPPRRRWRPLAVIERASRSAERVLDRSRVHRASAARASAPTRGCIARVTVYAGVRRSASAASCTPAR